MGFQILIVGLITFFLFFLYNVNLKHVFCKCTDELNSNNKLKQNHFLSFETKSKNGENFNIKKKTLSLSDIENHVFKPDPIFITWVENFESKNKVEGLYIEKKKNIDNKYLFTLKSINDQKFNFEFFNGNSFVYQNVTYKMSELIVSPNLEKGILRSKLIQTGRHSSISLFWILDFNSKEISPLYDIDKKLSFATWSPDGKKISFVYNNDIYIKDINNNKITQVTFDGNENIYNGIADWVYEEEIFSNSKLLWWSDSSEVLGFIRLNDSLVSNYSNVMFTQKDKNPESQTKSLKYPNPDSPNPQATAMIYNLVTGNIKQINLVSEKISPEDILITQFKWLNNENVLIKIINRVSQCLEIFIYSLKNKIVKNVRSYYSPHIWFDVNFDVVFVPMNTNVGLNHDGYIDVILNNGFNHLAYFKLYDKKGVLLTKGNWEVTNGIESFDKSNYDIYFLNTMKSSTERHLSSINLLEVLKNPNEIMNIKFITTEEGYYSSAFSHDSKYCLLNYEGPNIPYQKLINLRNPKKNLIIQDNSKLKKIIDEYDLPKVVLDTLELEDDETREKYKVNVMEILPPNFDKKKKYPVLFYAYGGPGSQLVTKKFSVGFNSIISSLTSSVIVIVDNRGTGYNNLNPRLSYNFKYKIKNNLGLYESKDQIAAAKIWSKKVYVNPDKIAIWGWSYGGYLTLKCIESDIKNRVFSYGIAIAPVVDWKFYDSIYVERYMDSVEKNKNGYFKSSINNFENFKNINKLLLGHGTNDENVHLKHTMTLIDNFHMNNIKNYEIMIYPDSDHSISFQNANKILHEKIIDFLQDVFKKKN